MVGIPNTVSDTSNASFNNASLFPCKLFVSIEPALSALTKLQKPIPSEKLRKNYSFGSLSRNSQNKILKKF